MIPLLFTLIWAALVAHACYSVFRRRVCPETTNVGSPMIDAKTSGKLGGGLNECGLRSRVAGMQLWRALE